MDIDYFIKNPSEFTRTSREHAAETPKGNCWMLIVQHVVTGKNYRYFEEDNYYNLREQINDNVNPGWTEI